MRLKFKAFKTVCLSLVKMFYVNFVITLKLNKTKTKLVYNKDLSSKICSFISLYSETLSPGNFRIVGNQECKLLQTKEFDNLKFSIMFIPNNL